MNYRNLHDVSDQINEGYLADLMNLEIGEVLKLFKGEADESWTGTQSTNSNVVESGISGNSKDVDDIIGIPRQTLLRVWKCLNFLDVVKTAHQYRNLDHSWIYLVVADQALQIAPNVRIIEEILHQKGK